MSWAIGYDTTWQRDIGYGVPATCDYPDCGKLIDRGLSYVCGGEPCGGEHGCGLHFCAEHLAYTYDIDGDDLAMPQRCERCIARAEPFDPTPDVAEWTHHKMTDPSWARWRAESGVEAPQ